MKVRVFDNYGSITPKWRNICKIRIEIPEKNVDARGEESTQKLEITVDKDGHFQVKRYFSKEKHNDTTS